MLLRAKGSTIEAWRLPSGGSWSRLGFVQDATYPDAAYVGVGLRGHDRPPRRLRSADDRRRAARHDASDRPERPDRQAGQLVPDRPLLDRIARTRAESTCTGSSAARARAAATSSKSRPSPATRRPSRTRASPPRPRTPTACAPRTRPRPRTTSAATRTSPRRRRWRRPTRRLRPTRAA